jgi:hypothetical protein
MWLIEVEVTMDNLGCRICSEMCHFVFKIPVGSI